MTSLLFNAALIACGNLIVLSIFCFAELSRFYSSFAIILTRKRELAALL